MTGSKPWRAACAALALALAGCQASVSSERQVLRPLQDTWRPDLLFVRSQPYPRLVVEVDAVRGCEPSPETLSALREFLVRHVDKPGGVEVVVKPLIPPADARRMRLNQLLLSTLGVPTDETAARQDTATIRILCYDSRQLRGQSGEGLEPHSNALPYPAQIFFDRACVPADSRRAERVVLQHEVGHVLGLVGDPARGDGAHCRNDQCLMWPKVGISWVHVTLLHQQVPLRSLCTECEADLARSRASAADAHARFVGRALVRNADGYAFVGIPGGGFLCVGTVDAKAVASLIERARARADGADHDGLVTGSLVPDDQSPDAVRHTLEQAERDPDPVIRRVARSLRATYDKAPTTTTTTTK